MQIEAYLFFGGNCEEALGFYRQCLGGEVPTLMRYGGSPMDNGQLPAGWKEKVMHATFESTGARFMASDGMPGEPPPSYGGFSMALHLPGDVERARRTFDALAEGGRVAVPFSPPFWGGHFGMLTDRFGVPWMVTTDQ
ncbi:MAG TPA: VOC family protein [Ramlibacter sp.]|jgi:PhnB protein|uniref:VOC family protein n=1 Tax=Ramlibacter sp. TaxID=1917967 RepID=UPI002D2ED36A|nr:VOC family protein [Ramlibacter sp.]HZY18980.1 VOC family protein [Ramlibacter sp.]